MVPTKTSIEDMQKLIGYLGRQVGWVELSKIEKSLGSTAVDGRKISAVVELGLVHRDNSNLKLTDRGRTFIARQNEALTESIRNVELYNATVEWFHYQNKTEVTAVEIGHYWETSHSDTLEGLGGETLKSGAVCFARIVEGAGLGRFLIGRGGKETRLELDKASVDAMVQNETQVLEDSDGAVEEGPAPSSGGENPGQPQGERNSEAPVQKPPVVVSASPSVHVNVEIHIAADATATTVREIFKNMAHYVLDKQVDDNDS